ncbi:hypothetical protein, partial [Enterobacter cloacae]
GIDWWEITFRTNMERAAADLYPTLYDLRPDAEKVAIDDHTDAINDEASVARETVDSVLIDGRIAKILTPDEMA